MLESKADAALETVFLEHLLEDYEEREGHAHILQWLYCLQAAALRGGEAGVYERGLVGASHMLLAKLSARDQALPHLFVDAPSLPPSALDELEWLCGLVERPDCALPDLDQRTLALIALRDVILHRSTEREACLVLVLRCTVHSDEALRSKAIRMVVNQLHPLPFAAAAVDDFATQRLKQQRSDAADESEETETDALSRVSLYFALCTRSQELIPAVFTAFVASSEGARAAFARNMVRCRKVNSRRLCSRLTPVTAGWAGQGCRLSVRCAAERD